MVSGMNELSQWAESRVLGEAAVTQSPAVSSWGQVCEGVNYALPSSALWGRCFLSHGGRAITHRYRRNRLICLARLGLPEWVMRPGAEPKSLSHWEGGWDPCSLLRPPRMTAADHSSHRGWRPACAEQTHTAPTSARFPSRANRELGAPLKTTATEESRKGSNVCSHETEL